MLNSHTSTGHVIGIAANLREAIPINQAKRAITIASNDEPAGSEKGEKAKNDEIDSEDRQSENIAEKDRLLVIMPTGERYNLIRHLHGLSPNIVILLHSDLVTLRILEVFIS
ncbi:hypothetical protein Tcan_12277 [Toxocara canis]|uniref:Uncharacterized protein n=1 Tax=Toxocara canis TaxID=6265 RepID=A0A0B2VRU5_TOXCA|nr:hypothetical protein Tcan_12277 [Toxocara canis]